VSNAAVAIVKPASWNETPIDFLRRNGPTLTHEFAMRFGLDRDDALIELKRLERAGELTKRRVAFSYGAGYEWKVE
jgi:hypothetical protein